MRYLCVVFLLSVLSVTPLAGTREAILGHELQHACEVAESGADNANAVRELFERASERNGRFYETRAAIEIEKHVRMELQSSRGLQAEPV